MNSLSFLSKAIKQKKIALLGLGKTGTSIAFYRIAKGLRFPRRLYFEPITFGISTTNEIASFRRKISSTNIFSTISKCLIQPQSLKDWGDVALFYEAHNKNIWMTRDPRDRLISDFLYGTYWRHAPAGKELEFAEYFQNKLRKVREKEEAPQRIPFFYLYQSPEQLKIELEEIYSPLSSSKSAILRDFHILRYEDLIDGKVEALSKYLESEIKEKVEVPNNLKRVTRTKTYGNWREWFTPEDVDLLKPILSEYLFLSGYDPEDWELVKKSNLDPKYGSIYMEKLYTDRSI